jgi:hypothetical protein
MGRFSALRRLTPLSLRPREPPPSGLDPDPADLDHLTADPDFRRCQGRKPLIDQTGEHAGAEAMDSKKRLRHTIAARGREQGESAALLRTQTRFRHRRIPDERPDVSSNQVSASRPAFVILLTCIATTT